MNSKQITISNVTRYAWLIWSIAAFFYAYEFALRVSITVMIPDLMHDFALDPNDMGILSALYFYAYAIMQIPVGILLDRYGARRILSLACLLVAGGCFVFAEAPSLFVAGIGRLLIGAGSAFAFVGCLKLSTHWFSARQFSFVVGMTNMLGALGAVHGQGPLAYFITTQGWRSSMLDAACLGAGIALLSYVLLRDNPKYQPDTSDESTEATLSGQEMRIKLREVLTCADTWIVAIFAGLMVVPIVAFVELWSVHFIGLKLAIDKTLAAYLNSLVFIGIAVGGPMHGWISGRFLLRKPNMLFGSIGGLITLSILFYFPFTSVKTMALLLFLLGFFTSSMLLSFSVAREINAKNISGFVIGFINMIIMIFGIVFQHLVSGILDWRWPAEAVASKGVELFTLNDFQIALLVIPLCHLLAIILLYFMRETHCHAQADCEH